MHRPDLNALPAGQRTQLAQLIQQYVTPAIVSQHLNAPPAVHSVGAEFLSWHRTYIAGLENFLVSQGHPEWSPLPEWNPANAIPAEFNIPNAGAGRLRDLTPNISFSPRFDHANLGNFRTDEDLGTALMRPHNTVHNEIGGIMSSMRAPEAPIFWLWHSFIDDIWWDWQRTTAPTVDVAWDDGSVEPDLPPGARDPESVLGQAADVLVAVEELGLNFGEVVDWNAIAEQVTANFEATGHWFV